MNVEILQIVRETYMLNKRNAEVSKIAAQNDLYFYEQNLAKLDEMISHIKDK